MKNEHLDEFARALRGHMARSGMKTQELADALGVTRQTVSAWRQGTAEPSVRSVSRMEQLLGLQAGELVMLIAGPGSDEDELSRTPHAAGYDARIADLPDSVKSRIDDILDAYEAGRG